MDDVIVEICPVNFNLFHILNVLLKNIKFLMRIYYIFFGYIIGIDELRLLICISYSELIMKQFFLAIILLIFHVISGRILKLFDTDKFRISLYFIIFFLFYTQNSNFLIKLTSGIRKVLMCTEL